MVLPLIRSPFSPSYIPSSPPYPNLSLPLSLHLHFPEHTHAHTHTRTHTPYNERKETAGQALTLPACAHTHTQETSGQALTLHTYTHARTHTHRGQALQPPQSAADSKNSRIRATPH